jgi:hypothetical protein
MISWKEAAAFVRKFRVASGDTILIKSKSELAQRETIERIGQSIEAAGYRNVLLLVVDDFDFLQSIPEKKMNEMGWFRVKALKQVIHQLDKEEAQSDVQGAPDS